MILRRIGLCMAFLALSACAMQEQISRKTPCTGSFIKSCNPEVYFDFAKADLDKETKAQLDWVAVKLKKMKQKDIVVIGHADKVSSDEYNMALSQQRARNVVDYLQKQGVPADRVKVFAVGSKQLHYTEDQYQYLERKVDMGFVSNKHSPLNYKLNSWFNRKGNK